MAADESARSPPLTLPVGESSNSGHESNLQGTKEEVGTEPVVTKSVREELVQSAVNFLKHPKVMASSDGHRRSFLEKKGLTEVEIDEAFSRLADQTSNATSARTKIMNEGKLDNPARSPQKEDTNDTDDMDSSVAPTSVPESEPLMPPHPKSYTEIIEMIQRGEKPSDIEEINDMPPDPNHPIPTPRLAPRPKPWEKQDQQIDSSNLRSEAQDDSSKLNARSIDTTEPEWRKKNGDGPNAILVEHRTDELKQPSSVTFPDEQFDQGEIPPQPPLVDLLQAANVSENVGVEILTLSCNDVEQNAEDSKPVDSSGGSSTVKLDESSVESIRTKDCNWSLKMN